VLHAARCKYTLYRMQKVIKKSPSGHHRTTFSGYIFTTKAHIDSWKKNLLSSNISSTCSHSMVNFNPLAAEISLVVCGTPANLWSPYVIGQTIYIFILFLLLSSFFPRLISAVGDWMFTILRHMVWP